MEKSGSWIGIESSVAWDETGRVNTLPKPNPRSTSVRSLESTCSSYKLSWRMTWQSEVVRVVVVGDLPCQEWDLGISIVLE